MRRKFTFVVALFSTAMLAGCHSASEPKPLDQLTAHETQGRGVFSAHCSQCHFDRSSMSLQGPSLLGVFKKQYLPSGAPANDDRVTATIRQGRSMMPAFPDIDPQELSDLLAYLHTL